ncbi:3-phosphoshikimate 1-carboxyvinyltransferase [Thiohalocapsa marina]|uniref:3-phosphoshikimate 1-carboxyvinyltransferase n=1 Tax=Thiohalocapsa marina TaxID=424902 RepID=A0A5M8FTH7_9GAMM|nr:3-phosphoshikimate 1-carboxyvinyltransferase [Thiohalocapsa marina]
MTPSSRATEPAAPVSTPASNPASRQPRFVVAPGGTLRGQLRVPGDKSISHRAIMLGAIADGVTEISGFLEGADALATLAAFRAMGVVIDGPDRGRVRVMGAGLEGLRDPGLALAMGNSGTSMRLLSGLLSGQRFATTLTGDASLSRRPMRRVTEPLRAMGAEIETTSAGTAPLVVRPVANLHGIHYRMPVASAQVKSSLLLAGLYATGETCVTEPAPTRDHTERMLTAFGYPLERTPGRVCLHGGGRLRAIPIAVPADISSAAFFLVGASIAPGSELLLQGVGLNPTRIGVINILRAMGADIGVEGLREEGAEPVADLRVRPAPLRGIEIPADQVPLAIDEFPALFIAAACAEGETLLTGAEELRVKESDRIAVMAEGLTALGIRAEVLPDGIRIVGRGQRPDVFTGGRVHSHDDHRIAMSFAMAALRASGPVEIEDCANVDTSFPGFAALAAGAGLGIVEEAA